MKMCESLSLDLKEDRMCLRNLRGFAVGKHISYERVGHFQITCGGHNACSAHGVCSRYG